MDPIKSFEAVLRLAKERRNLSDVLTMVRRIDESDQKTIQRLITERAVVVKLLRECGARCRPFDHEFKENFIEMVKERLG
jgi:hypothetical protein